MHIMAVGNWLNKEIAHLSHIHRNATILFEKSHKPLLIINGASFNNTTGQLYNYNRLL